VASEAEARVLGWEHTFKTLWRSSVEGSLNDAGDEGATPARGAVTLDPRPFTFKSPGRKAETEESRSQLSTSLNTRAPEVALLLIPRAPAALLLPRQACQWGASSFRS
jgi:hypothetical protein